jgi:hypothetical protein
MSGLSSSPSTVAGAGDFTAVPEEAGDELCKGLACPKQNAAQNTRRKGGVIEVQERSMIGIPRLSGQTTSFCGALT